MVYVLRWSDAMNSLSALSSINSSLLRPLHLLRALFAFLSCREKTHQNNKHLLQVDRAAKARTNCCPKLDCAKKFALCTMLLEPKVLAENWMYRVPIIPQGVSSSCVSSSPKMCWIWSRGCRSPWTSRRWSSPSWNPPGWALTLHQSWSSDLRTLDLQLYQ